jgi:hypothetical protein
MAEKQPLSRKLQTSFLSSVIEFMVRVGVSEREIRASFESGVARASRLPRVGNGKRGESQYRAEGDVSAYLLRLWNRDERLVDSVSLAPRPLPLLKGKDSLRSLIATLNPTVDPLRVLKAMKAARLIRRKANGRYVPADDGAIFSTLHPWAIEHTARSVIRLVNTVCRNAGASAGEPRLLERYTYVPDLDPANMRAFAEFSRMQGLNYLQSIDDWLEQKRIHMRRRVSRRSPKGVAAGVHLIAFLDEVTSSRVVAKKSVRRRVGERSIAGNPTSPPSAPA